MPPSGDNQKSYVKQYIGRLVTVSVEYSSPDVHAPNGDDRSGKIWGGLVPYGLTDLGFGVREPAPWRAGTNENTVISFSHDVLIDGKPLPAGKYGLHLILAETGPWTWIFSKNNSAWGSYFYTTKDDVLRVQAQPRDNPSTEWLTYTFTDRKPAQATLELQWERKAVPMKITVPNMNDLYVSQIDRELQSSPGFDPDNYANAANFLLQENHNLDKALVWADQAIDPAIGQKNFNSVSTKTNVLLKMGKKEEAINSFSDAMAMSDASAGAAHQLGRTLIGQGEKDTALKIFQMNHEKHKGEWPTNVGMARGLSAVGRYDEAVKYAEAALAEAPDDINQEELVLKSRDHVHR